MRTSTPQKPVMHLSSVLTVTFALISTIFICTCTHLEPQRESGVLSIGITYLKSQNSVPKNTEKLTKLQFILKRGETTISNNYYKRTEDYFQIIIGHLQPAADYRIELWGFDEDNTVVGQSKSDDIIIHKDKVTHVTLTWVPFRLTLTSPDDSTVTTNTCPLFNWYPIESALLYEFQIDTTDSFTGTRKMTVHTGNAYYQPEDPLADGWYYWRIRCQDTYWEWSPYTSSNTIQIKTHGPPPPLLLSPEDGVRIQLGSNLTFDWSDVPGAESYQLVVSDSDSFVTKLYSMGGFQESGATVSGQFNQFEEGTYYWHVACRDEVGNKGDWSETFSFHLISGSHTLQYSR